MVAACASAHGWRVVYLGPSLPADEIVGAARQSGVRAVALSLVHPEDDPGIPEELARLRRLLPHEVAILAGGRACGSYRRALEDRGHAMRQRTHSPWRLISCAKAGTELPATANPGQTVTGNAAGISRPNVVSSGACPRTK